jgi:hypothetical protein
MLMARRALGILCPEICNSLREPIGSLFVWEGKMEIEWIAVDEVIPYENNPRKNEASIDKVAASIKEFGFK